MKSRFAALGLTVLCTVITCAMFGSWLLFTQDRYHLLDFVRLQKLPEAARALPVGPLAQASPVGGEQPTILRAEPIDLGSSDILIEVNEAMASLTSEIVKSVVSIDTKTNVDVTRVVPSDPLGLFGYRRNERYQSPGLGSGVIVTGQGHIVTNHHVVAGVDEIRVTLHGGSIFEAEWIGSDPETDIAVLKLMIPAEGEKPAFMPLPFGDSDEVRVGEMALAVGNPFGLSETVTRGIISAKQRELSDGSNEYFQVDAVINPGNSGGPLVNVRGEIIGINVAIFTGQKDVRVWQGIGLAIPANEAKEVFEAIVYQQPIIRGYIGVDLANVPSRYAYAVRLPSTRGAVVTAVNESSPAERAGLKPGDIILRFDGREVATAEDALRRIRKKKVEEVAKLSIIRMGKALDVEVYPISRSDTTTLQLQSDIVAGGQSIAEALGLEVRDIQPNERASLQLSEQTPAVMITNVGDSAANNGAIRPGDLVHRINRDDVASRKDFYDLLGKLPKNQSAQIILSRNGRVFRAILKNGG